MGPGSATMRSDTDKSLHLYNLQRGLGNASSGISVAELNRIMKSLRLRVLLLTVALLGLSNAADAGSVTLAWDASPDPAVAGYNLYWGTQPGNTPNGIPVGNQTMFTVNGLTDGVAYYFTVRSYNGFGV